MISVLSSFAGFLLLLIRFRPVLFSPARKGTERLAEARAQATVSIVVPARNEASNLPRLLNSLALLKWSKFEIVVVDDQSTDQTRELAQEFARRLAFERPDIGFELVEGQERPTGWAGKNWACHQGYQRASGQFLLFTDADTSHQPESLRAAVARMQGESLDLLTALPFHRCDSTWERLIGPFYLLPLIATAAFARPRIGRLFAIGQFLLFRREMYEKQGGHQAIRGQLCDDLELAHQCLENNGRYAVEGKARLFDVRMYASFTEFVQGWRRIFRLGFHHARLTASVEMYFVVAATTASVRFFAADLVSIVLMLLSGLVFGLVQKRYGEFHWFGVVLLPLSLLLFVVISGLAVFDLLLSREYNWRGRTYRSATRAL